MNYTTIDAISRRIQGRLQVGGTLSALGEKQISQELIEQIGDQVEARLDGVLRGIYEFPLAQSHPELASIVEKCTISEIIPVYEVSPEGREGDSWSGQLKKECQMEMAAIAERTITLPGESVIFTPSTTSPNSSKVFNRSSTQSERDAGFEQERCYRKGDKINPIQADSVRW
jgi:hypothetical protein